MQYYLGLDVNIIVILLGMLNQPIENVRHVIQSRQLNAESIGIKDSIISIVIFNIIRQMLHMPFAPCVLEEDADEVFEVTDANRYAMRFMTITCQVRKAWRARIPAVVHVDGTARPQIVREEWNPLYAQILRCFKQRSGLPVLVNTSFNAHEEPIIHTPAECLRALRGGRVDYVAAESGVYRLRQTKPRASRWSAR